MHDQVLLGLQPSPGCPHPGQGKFLPMPAHAAISCSNFTLRRASAEPSLSRTANRVSFCCTSAHRLIAVETATLSSAGQQAGHQGLHRVLRP